MEEVTTRVPGATAVNDESSPAPPPTLVKPKTRMDYYQTDPDVIVSLYLKGLKKEDVILEFSEESVSLKL